MDLNGNLHRIALFAGHNSFEVRDSHAGYDLAGIDDTANDLQQDRISSRDGVVSIGTARRRRVPVVVEISAHAPADDLDGWDHVAETSVDVDSGWILVLGGSESQSGAARFELPAGTYRVRVYSEGFGAADEDAYRVVLWPGRARPTTVLKRFTGEPAGW